MKKEVIISSEMSMDFKEIKATWIGIGLGSKDY
jgi:hypothetical protein